MEIQQAIEVIRHLANSVDPETQQNLDENSICRRPLTVKALNRALAALIAEQEREQLRPNNAWKRWSHAEDQQVCEELRKGADFHAIAKAHDRSLASILARLVKLGKIAPGKSVPPKVA
jgi:hypothetical protein